MNVINNNRVIVLTLEAFLLISNYVKHDFINLM